MSSVQVFQSSKSRAARSAWEPHCERSRQIVLAATQRCERRRKAVILGSGWLLDVPLAELCSSFNEVVLVDLLPPLATRWRTRRYRSVSLLAADVSGTAQAVWQAVEDRSSLPRSVPDLFIGDEEVDLVVSLNLLSQLPCMRNKGGFMEIRPIHEFEPARDRR